MSSLYKELEYTSKIKEIKGVQFSILSPDEIKNRSVAHITETILYDSNGDPTVGEGFVYWTLNGAIKLVNREEFSYANFTNSKFK